MEIRKLHDRFGAEVLGLDVAGPVAAGEVDALREAFDRHQLLLFRCGERLAPDRQVEISSWFGPISLHFDGLPWTVLHNQNSVGSAKLPFHSDFSFTEQPLAGLSLQAIALPPGGSSTSFASALCAWETLSPERQAQLAPMTLRHCEASHLYTPWPAMTFDHPLRLPHPRNGRPVLFLTENHAERIHELPADESDRLIAELIAHLYSPAHVYEHRWTLYDLVVWDNIAVQHARTAEAPLSEGERAVQRVSLNSIGISDMVERARRHQVEPLPA